eukprot:Hpha_TRINITY_DN15922_c1_g2::TRINITY_DN15922_c1_g2_i1::g.71603::m.71603
MPAKEPIHVSIKPRLDSPSMEGPRHSSSCVPRPTKSSVVPRSTIQEHPRRPRHSRAGLVAGCLLVMLALEELGVAAVTSDWELAPALAALFAAGVVVVASSLASGVCDEIIIGSLSPRSLGLISGHLAVSCAAFASVERGREDACQIVLAAAVAVTAVDEDTVSVVVGCVTIAAGLVAAGAGGGSFVPAVRLAAGGVAIAVRSLVSHSGQREFLSPESAALYQPSQRSPSTLSQIDLPNSPVNDHHSCDRQSRRSTRSKDGEVHPSSGDCEICGESTVAVLLCEGCRRRPTQSPPLPQSTGSVGELLRQRTEDPFKHMENSFKHSESNGSQGESMFHATAGLRSGPATKKRSGVSTDGYFVTPMHATTKGLFGRPAPSELMTRAEDLQEIAKRESLGDVDPDGEKPLPITPTPARRPRNDDMRLPLSNSIRRGLPNSPLPGEVTPDQAEPSSPSGPAAIPAAGLQSPGRQRASAVELPDRKYSRSFSAIVSNRSRSLCSNESGGTRGSTISRSSSIASAHGSYVSFVAQVRRDREGGSFALAGKRGSHMMDEDGMDEDLDPVAAEQEFGNPTPDPPQGQSPNPGPAERLAERQPSAEPLRRRAPSSKRRVSQAPRLAKSPASATPRERTDFFSGPKLNLNPTSPTPGSVGSPAGVASPFSGSPASTNRGMSLLQPPAPRTAEETKEATKATREIVKSVVELDFSSKADFTGLRPFQSLPTTTLQQLVILFGRLAEELETFRAQQFIVACVCEVMKCDRAAIFLAEWKHQTMSFISDEGQEIRVPMEGSLAGYAAIHRKVLNIRDAYSDPRFNKDVDRRTGYTTRNLLVYPISRGVGYDFGGSGGAEDSGREVVAVIEAINKNDGSFTPEDENVLALLGKQAGIHMSNAQTHQQLQLQGLKAQTLLEVSKEIADIKIDLGEMMARIMSRARQVLTVARASIFLIDEEKQELWSILTDTETATQLGGDNVIRFPVGVGLAGHVASTGQVLNIADTYKHPLFNPEFDHRTGFVTRSTLCVPIRGAHHGNKVMGVMQFINKHSGEPFMDEDEELALSFSSFVAISLNNILLYDELREGQFIREKNRELEILRDQAQQAAEAKSNFLMAMSHEIRTPMGGVIGMTELLQGTEISADQREMTDTIKSCGEALMAIINDVLDYGKLESGRLELEQREVDLVVVMEDTIDVIRPKADEKCITLIVSIDPETPCSIIGDEYRLRQVLTNLLGNAVKFTPVGGDITLCARSRHRTDPRTRSGSLSPRIRDTHDACTNEWLYFCVQDTGIGITEEAQGRLFRPFEQAEAGTTRQFGGSGLGLAICRQLVDAMCGSIGIVSKIGEGSSFWFTAKFGKNAAGKERTLQQSLPPLLAAAKVTLACSHRGLQATLQTVLKGLGTEYECVDSFPKLLEGLENPVPPHLVVVDEGLDGMDDEGLRDFLPESARKRRIALSDDTRLHIAPMASVGTKAKLTGHTGFAGVFSKPPKISALARVINRALSGGKDPAKGKQAPAAPEKSMEVPVQKLLIAEDNVTNQKLFRKQLQLFNIVPTMCDNGQIAVDRLTEEFHDLVFMDCHMPVLDGYGATRKIRALEQEGSLAAPKDGVARPVCIVALTADALPDTRGKCVEAGMDDYMTKPLRKATLQQVLDKYFYKTDP